MISLPCENTKEAKSLLPESGEVVYTDIKVLDGDITLITKIKLTQEDISLFQQFTKQQIISIFKQYTS